MKSFKPTTSVLIVLSVAVICLARTQSTGEESHQETVEEALAVAQMEAESARKDLEAAAADARMRAEAARKEAEAVAKQAEAMQRQKEAILLDKLRLDLSFQLANAQQDGGGIVLVVPAAEMKAEELAAIMQDMNIMARIFDKKLNYPLRLVEGETLVLGGLLASGRGKHFISGDDKATKAIYVGGYGAVFFIKVNFPLSPPREVKVEKIEEGVDPVWEQTKQEIYSSKEARATIVASPDNIALDEVLKSLHARTSRLPEYDAEKVDELNRKLTKTLKHAANIRGLKSQDFVVLAVTGTPQPVVITEIHYVHGDEAGKTITVTPKMQEAESTSSTVLTIRVKKSDIDAFSKSELDFDQFQERVQILTSQAKLGGQQQSDILYRLGVNQSSF